MSRYIEYHDICSAIDNQQDGTGMTYEALAHAMVEIQLAPSIDIVRCKECRCYIDFIGEQFINAPTLCGRLSTLDNYVVVNADDFCSYGERRE